jgi:hypothetical protein
MCVCSPKAFGGLGIPNLTFFGYSLWLRCEWYPRIDPFKCWVDLPATSEQAVTEMFEASPSEVVSNGRRTLFWSDRWLNGASIKSLAPNLFHAVAPRVRSWRLVVDALQDSVWTQDITRPLTVDVLSEFLSIWDELAGVQLRLDQEDTFAWEMGG